MGKRIIFTEDNSKVGAEIEMFVNVDGLVTIIIKYEKDEDFELRCISLNPIDFNQMIDNVEDDVIDVLTSKQE